MARRRNRLSGLSSEFALAVLAVADAAATHPRPTVVGDALGMRSLDDLPQNVRQILVVIGAVDARGVLVGRAVRAPVGGTREPVRVGLVEVLAGAIGIHPRHHHQTVAMRGLRHFAVEIAAVQKLRPILQRKFTRIVRHDAAGVDDHALHLGALPIVAPPRDVVLHRIQLREVGLPPTVGAQVPRLLVAAPRLRRRGSR